MLVTNLINELKNHKKKIIFIFFLYSILSLIFLTIGQSKYINQIIYIDIKEVVNFRSQKNLEDPKTLYDTNDFFDVIISENKYFSPNYIEFELELNSKNFYTNFIDKELFKKISKSWRPGYNILVFYNQNERRYEITVQLFNDHDIFNKVRDMIVDGINSYFKNPSFYQSIEFRFNEITNRFNNIKQSIFDIKRERENNLIALKDLKLEIELVLNNRDYKNYNEKFLLKKQIFDLNRRTVSLNNHIVLLDSVISEFDKLESFIKEYSNPNNFYEISFSNKKVVNRGLFPEYIVILFILLFIGTAVLISYISLLKKNKI